jgi:hypothetical protein
VLTSKTLFLLHVQGCVEKCYARVQRCTPCHEPAVELQRALLSGRLLLPRITERLLQKSRFVCRYCYMFCVQLCSPSHEPAVELQHPFSTQLTENVTLLHVMCATLFTLS